MTDDPSQAAAAQEPVPVDQPEPAQAAYVQLVEVAATPVDAVAALERRDAYGRVPVVVRIQRQPPISLGWVLLAIGLAASGLFVPLQLALRAVIIVGAAAALVVGIVSRLFIRVPPGSVGLTVKGGRHDRILPEGVHTVNPMIALTHLVTTRELAFDVPVSAVRSRDGVGVSVDLLLALAISDPVRFAYGVSTGDADQLVHAASQDAVRTLVRGLDALAALDLGDEAAARLRETIDAKLEPYGIDARSAAFTRVGLPEAFTQSLEARRLATVQLEEQSEAYALERRRLADHAALVAQEAESRRAAVEHEAAAEEVRLARLDARLAAHPDAARYDLEQSRIRIAAQLAGNSRAVVSLGAPDLVSGLLLAREAADAAAVPPAVPPAGGTMASKG